MKTYSGENIVLVMAAGVGSRFGSDKPKQYCIMSGKQIIEYSLDACRYAESVDDIVVVVTQEYLDEIYYTFGYRTVQGGKTRAQSLANGLKFVADNYNCNKIIIANAVCPLMTSEQINKYFSLLDDYDYVLTSWKIVSTLGKNDGTLVNRDDYFQCMEPEAYRFNLLYENYSSNYPVPYIFHQLPRNSRGFKCFDYPYTMKITYPYDTKIAEVLYREFISQPLQEKTRRSIDTWLSSYGHNEIIGRWLRNIPNDVQELADKWDIERFTMNPQTFATCVFEGYSRKFGDVIMKFHAPTGRYNAELSYYKFSGCNSHMARLIDYDDDYRAMLIERVKPGLQVKFDANDPALVELFDDFAENFISVDKISCLDGIPTMLEEFHERINISGRYNVLNDFRHKMEETALRLWEDLFDGCEKFFLHRDLHRRNLLSDHAKIKAIDPLGVIAPKEFEFTISLIIEAKSGRPEPLKTYDEMMKLYSKYCDYDRLRAAAFITWVHKMDEYVFAKHDNFFLANWCADMISNIFFEGREFDESANYYSCI